VIVAQAIPTIRRVRKPIDAIAEIALCHLVDIEAGAGAFDERQAACTALAGAP
jgi:hypothetical protein